MSILFLLQMFVFTQDPFVESLKKASPEQQILMLEKRLTFMATRDLDLPLEEPLELYIKSSKPAGDKVEFLGSILKIEGKSNEGLKTAILDKILEPQYKAAVLSNSGQLLLSKGKNIKTRIGSYIIRQVNLDDLDWVLANDASFKNLIKEVASLGGTYVSRPLQKAQMFGYNQLAEEILKENKSLVGKDLWVKFYSCNQLYLAGKLPQATNCYSSNDESVWFQLATKYLKFLDKSLKEDDLKKYEEIKKSIIQNGGKDIVILYDLLFYKKETQEVIEYLKSYSVEDNYWQTFALLKLDKKLNFLDGKQKNDFKIRFSRAFPDQVFERLLKGEYPSQSLVKKFPENSLVRQILNY